MSEDSNDLFNKKVILKDEVLGEFSVFEVPEDEDLGIFAFGKLIEL